VRFPPPTFTQLSARAQAPLDSQPYDRWLTPAGDPGIEFHRMADGYLMRFPGQGDFAYARADHDVACTPAPETPQPVIDALLHNQVIPLVRSSMGQLVLHGSAVNHSGRGLGFLGPTGRGKSTLAAAFASRGHAYLTDDGLMLDEAGGHFTALPGHAFMRLWADSEAAVLGRDEDLPDDDLKTHVRSSPAVPFQTEPVPLSRIYVLGTGDRSVPTITPLSPAAALDQFLRHGFMLDVEDHALMRSRFDQLARLAQAIPCYGLDYPRRYDALPQVIAAVLAHDANGDGKP